MVLDQENHNDQVQDGAQLDPQAVLRNVEQLMATIQHLDWQLTSTKHMLRKYKDLTIAQQLHINAQAVKLSAVKYSRNELFAKCEEMQEQIS